MFSLRRDRLRYCPSCRGELACPTGRTAHGDFEMEIALRCAECGHCWATVVNHARAAMFDAELGRDAAAMSRSLLKLDLERMAIEAESLAAAFARDLIGPADFAT
jgi:hypothetical protein